MSYETQEHTAVTARHDDLALILTDDDSDAVPLQGRKVTIGRAEDNDLVLDDRFVSSRHCQVEERKGLYRVRDLGSRNGTRLNGVKIERGLLSAGDRIRIGGAVLLCVTRVSRFRCWNGPAGMVGRSRVMRRVFADLNRFAAREAVVLIEGETGTGKELAARAVHQLSSRDERPFVAVNCGAFTPELAHSELFGHERGAFTGAALRHKGAFEQADGGTLFLDEVGELDPRVQSALLRVLETGQIRRVGTERDLDVDVRVVAATNRDLAGAVHNGSFREDLYHRLAVLRVTLPPLRDRLSDLPGLTRALLERIDPSKELTDGAEEMLRRHAWPGNVRELRNVLERACALTDGARITARELRFESVGQAAIERELASLLLAVNRHGSIAAAARALGIPRTTLRDRIYKLQNEEEGPGR